LPVGFYGCESCSVALKEELTVKVYEKRVLRRIFEIKGEMEKKLYNMLRNF
jgi:hypothetical protein